MSKQKVSETLTIKASASKIFDLICDPKKHLELDGNGQLIGPFRHVSAAISSKE